MIYRIQLNRPKAKNALDTASLQSIQEQLLAQLDNKKTNSIFIDSASDDYFSSGGDVKSLYFKLKENDLDACKDFFSTEYATDYLIHIYPKPIISWASGIQFGGGLGLVAGAKYRVLSPTALLSMPEVLIGLFPDVGASYFLQKTPKELRDRIALNAKRLNANEAVFCNLADYVIQKNKEDVFTELSKSDDIETTLSKYNVYQQPDDFSIEDYELENNTYASPTSLAFVKKQLEVGKSLSLRKAFEKEYQYAIRFCMDSDFFEGVRALLVDKDKKPRWKTYSINSLFKEYEHKDFLKKLDDIESRVKSYEHSL